MEGNKFTFFTLKSIQHFNCIENLNLNLIRFQDVSVNLIDNLFCLVRRNYQCNKQNEKPKITLHNTARRIRSEPSNEGNSVTRIPKWTTDRKAGALEQQLQHGRNHAGGKGGYRGRGYGGGQF